MKTSTIENKLNKSPAPTNLIELANQHLSTIGIQNSGTKLFLPQLKTGVGLVESEKSSETKFFIPKLGFKPSNDTASILKKPELMTQKKEQSTSTIDLSSVLLDSLDITQEISDPTNTLLRTSFVVKDEILKLIKNLNLEVANCKIDSHYLLAIPMLVTAKKRSNLANIITRQYKIRPRPYSIRHVFKVVEQENMPKKFDFTTPSPDDQILKHLKNVERKT